FLALSRRAREMGIDLKKTGLRVMECAGESWSNAYRQRMEREWGITFNDSYGSSEMGSVATECSEKTGMHYWEDMMIVEIVDPETGKVLGPGQYGEIVATSLYHEAMPLLRYRMGDVAAWLPYEPCGCGRTLAKISRVKGRTEHMVRVGEARIFPVDVEEVIHGAPELTGEYQIVLRKPGVQEVLEANAEYHPGTGGLDVLAARLEAALETSTGAKSKVNLLPSGKIPAGMQFTAQRITKAYA
ncbi:MAG: phenylacetate--CoA ligase, partial [Chloroflexi bacterium]|nr:phenylacetate--CoA ligase [Chloroflexota bacterium]